MQPPAATAVASTAAASAIMPAPPPDAFGARAEWLRKGLLAAVLACGLAACFFYTFNHDAAYILYNAGQILQGYRLYVDLPEINPPLIVWLNLPVAGLARWLGADPALLFRLCMLALALLAVGWSAWLLRAWAGRDALTAWLATGLYAALLAPAYSFGQREHIAFLCSLPYLAEAARRIDGAAAARAAQLAAAAFATLGLALKPHFLLVPLLVEAIALYRLRRPGVGVAAAALLLPAYLLAVWLVVPQYLDTLRMFSAAYAGLAASWTSLLGTPEFYATALLALASALARPRHPLARVAWAAVAGFALAAVIQRKGFSYHWVAAMASAWLLAGLAVVSATAHRSRQGVGLAPLIIAAVVAVLSVLALARAVVAGPRVNPNPSYLGPVIRELGGGPVMIFSTAEVSFPLVLEPGIGTSTRYATWTGLPPVLAAGNRAAIAAFHRGMAEDFARRPPRLLVVQTDRQGVPVIDFIRLFTPDAPGLAQYRVVRQLNGFQVLQAPVNR
jgi:hypothetical protein